MLLRHAVALIVAFGGSLSLIGQEAKPLDLTSLKGGEEVSFEIADGVKMVFCWIPKGKATLGSPETEQFRREKNESEREFASDGFWLGKSECTQKQWASVMGKNPSFFSLNGFGKEEVQGLVTDNFPVEKVNWADTHDFLKKLNAMNGVANVFGKAGSFQLPHEDQWEYAYRGGKGNKQAFYWGDTLNGDKANCNGDLPPYGTKTKGVESQRTSVVGYYAKVASHPWGLFDMSGNVWEWCENWHSREQEGRAVRGGCYGSFPSDCRGAYHSYYAPDSRSGLIGFRVCVIPN